MSDERLPIIGFERAVIQGLGKALHDAARSVGDYTPRHETPRGERFEVRLAEGRIAKVSIEFDRIEKG